MICLSVSRSPHASATPSSVASISTRRACATSLKHSSPCPPRPTASPPPTSPLACAFSANKALFRTAPATRPTISKNSAANRSFSGSPTLAGTAHSRPAFAQWPPSWCFATKPSNPCSLPLNLSTQPAAHTTPDPSTPTTVPYRLPCMASSTSSALPLEYRQFFCRASPLSAYAGTRHVTNEAACLAVVKRQRPELLCGHVAGDVQPVAYLTSKKVVIRILERADIKSRRPQLLGRRIKAEVSDAARIHVQVVGPLKRKSRLDSCWCCWYRPSAVRPMRRAVGQQPVHQPRVRLAGGLR